VDNLAGNSGQGRLLRLSSPHSSMQVRLCCVLVVANYGTVAIWWLGGGGGGTAAGATATVSRGAPRDAY